MKKIIVTLLISLLVFMPFLPLDASADAWDEGWEAGYEEGYWIGQADANASIEYSFKTSQGELQDSYRQGYNKGKSEGYDIGYDKGYELGKTHANNSLEAELRKEFEEEKKSVMWGTLFNTLFLINPILFMVLSSIPQDFDLRKILKQISNFMRTPYGFATGISNIGTFCLFMIADLPRKGKENMAKRENGGGTIRTVKGANGKKYYAYAPARYEYVDGVRKCVRDPLGSFTKKSDAKDAISNYRKKPTPKYNYTMAMIYEEWQAVAFPDLSKQTQYNYSAAWVQIREAWGNKIDIPVREITIADVKEVFDYWMEEHEVLRMGYGEKPAKRKVGPLSKSAMKKIKSTMKQMYDYAMAHHIVETNLASLAKIPKDAAEGTKRAFTDLEFKKLEKGYKHVAGGEAVYVLCYTGFRVTEFCQLTKFSYDPKKKTLTGGIKTEAGENRVVPVHPKIQPIIERWYNASKGILFPRENGKAYNKDSFRDQIWDPCMTALGLPDDLTPHSARHTCGTRLSAAGVSQEDIQAIMGHADFAVTANTYINQDISTLTQSMAKVQ